MMIPTNSFKKQYVFSELGNLRLHDLKAQKKTMSMKRFQNIPLNNQQVMELKYGSAKDQEQKQKQLHETQTNQHLLSTQFRIRLGKRGKQRLLSRLMQPKYASTLPMLDNNQSLTQVSQTSSIIRKCSKLKDNILTENKIEKLQRYTERQYTTLLEQSKWCIAVHCKRS